MELDKRTLTPVEMDAFSALFEVVIWYSPFPEERKQIPHTDGISNLRADTSTTTLTARRRYHTVPTARYPERAVRGPCSYSTHCQNLPVLPSPLPCHRAGKFARW
jgi:hypothetical protein